MIQIGHRKVGPSEAPLIIAEMSGNHNQSLDRALQIVDAAAQAGAHAIKLQTYTADTITLNCDSEDFQIHGGLWDGKTLYQLYQEAHMPWDWHATLFEHARKLGEVPVGGAVADDRSTRGHRAVGVRRDQVVEHRCVGCVTEKHDRFAGLPQR